MHLSQVYNEQAMPILMVRYAAGPILMVRSAAGLISITMSTITTELADGALLVVRQLIARRCWLASVNWEAQPLRQDARLMMRGCCEGAVSVPPC